MVGRDSGLDRRSEAIDVVVRDGWPGRQFRTGYELSNWVGPADSARRERGLDQAGDIVGVTEMRDIDERGRVGVG
jgi:hypothetical protein